MQAAARIARLFRIDPVTVLSADLAEWLVRVACANVIVADEKRAAAKRRRR